MIHIIIFILVVFAASLLLGAVIYLGLLIPNTSRRDRLVPFQKHYFAHRGFYDNESEAPENTREAFCLAVEAGYGIELDVQLTRDKQLVVIHDWDLKRVSGIDKKVCDLTYEELKQVTVFGSRQKIPLLTEVLQLVDGKVPLIVEIKVRLHYKETCKKVWDILKNYKGVFCVECFNPFAIHWFRKYYPWVIRGQLSSDFIRERLKENHIVQFVLTNLLLNFVARPDFIAYNHQYKKNLSFSLCKNLYSVKTAAWTIQNQKQLEENVKDFDIIIFDSFRPGR